jgi:hypothetical protein
VIDIRTALTAPMTTRRANVAWAVAGAALAAMLLLPHATMGDSLGWRRALTPPVTRQMVAAQRFRMDAQGLSAVEFHAVADGPAAGSYQLTLRDRTDPGVTRTSVVPAAILAGARTFVFRFAPIEASAGRDFELEVAPAPANPGRGIALRITRGDRIEHGGLLLNGVPRWASLAFSTHTATKPPMQALLDARTSDRPPGWLAIAALAVGWVALGFALRAPLETDDVLGR